MQITSKNLIKFILWTIIGVFIIKFLSIPLWIVIGVFILSILLIINYLKAQTYKHRAEVMFYYALFWAIVAFPYIVPYIPFFTGITAALIAGIITFLIVITTLVFIGNKIRD
jgi:hypothetical protein